MFEETRRSLTRYYVTVTITLFTLVVVSFLAVMTWVIYQDEKLEAIAFAKEEAAEYPLFIQKSKAELKITAVPDEQVTQEEIQNALRMFSIVQQPDGAIFPLTFLTEKMESWLLEQIKNHDLQEPQLMSYSIKDEKRRVFLVQEDIFLDGIFQGTVYAGKDVTIIWTVVKTMLYFSLFLVAFFTFFLFRFGKKAAARAMKPVESAMLKQKQFITDASHELKTPLSVLLTGTEVLKSDQENQLSDFSENIITDLQDEIHKMSKLVGNLLQLSKLDEEEIKTFQEEDVVKIASLTIEKLKPLAKKKSIQLFLTNTQPLYWPTNNESFSQILSILLDNAIKYTLEKGEVKVSLVAEAKKLFLQVQDNGIGIEKKEQEFIFERFYRADKARTRTQQSGAGLGLAIAKALSQKEKGEILVTSELGRGTIFTVIFTER